MEFPTKEHLKLPKVLELCHLVKELKQAAPVKIQYIKNKMFVVSKLNQNELM